MALRTRWYAYATALLAGLASALSLSLLRTNGAALLVALGVVCLICAALGVALSLAWPDKGWRWGLWLAGPLWFLILLGLLFAGHVYMFLTRDMPFILAITAAECCGAYVGSRVIRRSRVV